MKKFEKVRLEFVEQPESLMLKSSEQFHETMKKRRSVRDFSSKAVPRRIIENCIKAAATAPSGANRQPWHFVVVSCAELKRRIRVEAEKVEALFYTKDANRQWVDDLKHLGTSADKPFLEEAPYLIVVFSKLYDVSPAGKRIRYYYVNQSVGIAVGFLVAAIHNAGLACVTYTPAPMDFLNKILNQPENHSPFCILPVGYPKNDAFVPAIAKKPLDETATFL